MEFSLALDIRTLSFVTLLFCFLYGQGLLVYSLVMKRFRGIGFMAAGLLVVGLGFLGIALRNTIPVFLSVVVANSCIVGGYVLTWEGIARFRERAGILRWAGIPALGASVALFSFFTYVRPDVPARIMVISFMLAPLAFLSARELVTAMPRGEGAQHLMTALPLALFGLFSLFRGTWAMGESALADFLSAGEVHGLAFLMLDMQIVLFSFGILWIASTRLEGELREQSRRDPLTRLYNRRALAELTEREWKRAERHGHPLSIVMADLDHFKKLNDTYGHAMGDLVLAKTAERFQSMLRKQDILSRYGGEEFLVVLPDTDLDQAARVAEKMRRAMAGLHVESKGERLALAVSCGVAGRNPDDGSWTEVADRADKGLYLAKEQGRNRVCRQE